MKNQNTSSEPSATSAKDERRLQKVLRKSKRGKKLSTKDQELLDQHHADQQHAQHQQQHSKQLQQLHSRHHSKQHSLHNRKDHQRLRSSSSSNSRPRPLIVMRRRSFSSQALFRSEDESEDEVEE